MIGFEVEHCPDRGVEKIRDELGTRAVQRARFRCDCGVEFLLTVTMRVPAAVQLELACLTGLCVTARWVTEAIG